MGKQIINIGILAHVDAGKTTLTESLLYLGGEIKTLGDVDKGNTRTDFLDIEMERGISVRSASSTFHWKGVQINLIDTPGHIDFSAEVERSLRILDAAILVISAVEGVQAHTENICLALKEHQIPTIVFINKIDRVGADTEKAIREIKKDLEIDLFPMQKAQNEGEKDVSIIELWDENIITEAQIEAIANTNDSILEKYVEEKELSFDELDIQLQKASRTAQIHPLLMGVAKNQLGVENLLDKIIKYLPQAKGSIEKGFSALVFRVDYDKKHGKMFGIRVFDGKLKAKDIVFNATQKKEEKINLLKRYNAGSFEESKQVEAGDIAAISGLKTTKLGDVLGNTDNIPSQVKLNSPLLTVQIKATEEKDYADLAAALLILSEEDPELQFEWLREEKELHIKIMGWIQIEVIERILFQRFAVKAKCENPTVIYKETPIQKAEGYARYWMPKPCWAIIKFLMEPSETGSGVIYSSKLSVDKIHKKYQNEIERSISNALKQGIKGWEVTDIKITLIDGEDHEVHSRPGDFIIATPMAIMNGLENTGTKFLEPYIWFQIKAPEDLLGVITSDIIQMRGSFDSPLIENESMLIEGTIPVASSIDFPVKLSSRSGGKAKIKTRFHSYKECKEEFGVIQEYKGISPLDEAKYILKARKALQESNK
jgi:ribosomal protection tetracycline resistance protein